MLVSDNCIFANCIDPTATQQAALSGTFSNSNNVQYISYICHGHVMKKIFFTSLLINAAYSFVHQNTPQLSNQLFIMNMK